MYTSQATDWTEIDLNTRPAKVIGKMHRIYIILEAFSNGYNKIAISIKNLTTVDLGVEHIIDIAVNTKVDDIALVPANFKLEQNYPNPFNPTTKIRFSVPKAGSYTLKVYNVLGQEVSTLFNGQLNPGEHEVTFSGFNLSSGVYIYRLLGNYISLGKKMTLMK